MPKFKTEFTSSLHLPTPASSVPEPMSQQLSDTEELHVLILLHGMLAKESYCE